MNRTSVVEEPSRIGKTVGVCFMVIVDILAIFGNISIILTILQSERLRTKLSNLFVLNLAFIDFLSSLTILPISTAVFILGYWPWELEFCLTNGFINSLLVFVSILSLCLISIERFYAIRFTMHHAAHMTLFRTILALIIVWIISILLSMLPLIGLNAYKYRPNRAYCSYSLEPVGDANIFLVLVTIVCFLIPGCTVFLMYSGIYRVAHQVSIQIHPTPQGNACWTSDSSGTPCQVQKQTTNYDTNENESFGINIRPSIHIPHLKAMRSLILITFSYMLLWGPYFGMHIYGVVHGFIPSIRTLEILVTWLGYCSFAVNPFIYGWMNLCVREELFACLKKRCCFKKIENLDNSPNMPEDFYEFLQRTFHNDDMIQTNDIKLEKTETKSQCVDVEITDTNNEPYF